MDIRPLRAAFIGASATIGVYAAGAVWRAGGRASSVLSLVVMSFFAAAACEPVVNKLAKRGWRRGFAAGLILGGTLLVAVLTVLMVGASVIGEVRSLQDSIPQIAEDLEETIASWTGASVQLDGLVNRLQRADVEGAVGDAAITSLRVLGNLLAALLVSFYLVVDGPRLRKRICALLPPKHQGEVLRVWDLATEKTGSYLAARTLLAGLSAIFHAVVFAIIGVPYALPMGIWLGVVSQVIPIIGTYLAIGLPVVLALAEQHPGTALVAIVIAALYQQVENVVLTPKLTAKAVDVHPGVGFVAILVAAAAFGPVYSLLIIPVIATIQGFIVAYIKTHELIDDPRLNTGPIPPVKETSGDSVTRRSAKLKGSKGRREGSRSQ